MTGKVVIETEELVLRRWAQGDRELYDEHCNTPDVMAWLGGKQSPRALNDDVDWFESKDRKFGTTYWVVERKGDRAFLGWCGLVVLEKGDEGISPDLVGELEIGWRFRSDVEGLGYAKQSAIAAMDFAFDELAAEQVISTVSQGNVRSWGLMRRLGMRHDFALDYGHPGDWRTLVYTMNWRDWDGEAVRRSSPRGRYRR